MSDFILSVMNQEARTTSDPHCNRKFALLLSTGILFPHESNATITKINWYGSASEDFGLVCEDGIFRYLKFYSTNRLTVLDDHSYNEIHMEVYPMLEF